HQEFFESQDICVADHEDAYMAGDLENATITLTITDGTPQISPIGTAPIIPSEFEGSFNKGLFYTGKSLLLPKAGNVIEIDLGFEYPSLSISASNSIVLTSTLGELNSISIRAGSSASDPVIDSPTIFVDQILTWYVIGSDLEGNISAVDSTIQAFGDV